MQITKPKNSNKPSQAELAFLISQVGAHAAVCFAERIAPLKLKPYHSGILRLLENDAGLTQQALCDLLGMFPSRLVGLLDELEKLKMIERRKSPSDRRTHALYLTKTGRETLAAIGKIARQHQDDLCAALNEKERKLLAEFLARIVAQQQITPAVHPGYRQLGEA